MRILRPINSPFRLAILAFLVASACGESTAPVSRPQDVLITGSLATVYAGDEGALVATVLDQSGEPMNGVALTWETEDEHLIELQPDGSYLALSAGNPIVRARVTADPQVQDEAAFPIAVLPVESVTITNGPFTVAIGDARVLGVRVTGPGGRNVAGRLVTIASDDPSIALVDDAGRVRGVAAGTATVRASADGVEGTVVVTVAEAAVAFDLAKWDDHAVPFEVDSGWVMWDGQEYFHVIRVDSGSFHLAATDALRWELRLRIREYRVVMVGPTRTLVPILNQNFLDRGRASFDAHGDLALDSELYESPTQHADFGSLGVVITYRVPGEDTVLRLEATRRQGVAAGTNVSPPAGSSTVPLTRPATSRR